MYKWIFAIFCSAILSFTGLAQGSGSSVQLTGSNYINVDSSYRFLSNPISFTCWVKRSNIDFGNMFMSSYYAGGYSGISAQITPSGQFAISYGDGTGFASSDRKSVISSSAHLFQNVWVHCAFVNLSSTSGVIYINGVLVASFNDGSGGAWFQSATGNGAIGIHSGDLGIYYHVGELDDMTIWNKALTATEVRNMVCRNANGASSQLLGYYNFDTQVAGQVFDSSPNGHDGTFVGSVLMPLSAAAIGDTSYYTYSTSSVASFSQTLVAGHQLEVAAISPNTKGVQVYEVFSAPNSTSGIAASSVVTDYFGVFLAVTDNATKSFQLKVNNWNAAKQLYKRDANNDLTWVPVSPVSVTGSTATFPADQFRQEYAIVGSQIIDTLCNIVVPNVFTPNDDTENDHFDIEVNCSTTSFSIKIFNRWGGLVYESDDPYFKWDGTFKNRFLSDGVYAYILTYSGFDKVVNSKHGLITLMR